MEISSSHLTTEFYTKKQINFLSKILCEPTYPHFVKLSEPMTTQTKSILSCANYTIYLKTDLDTENEYIIVPTDMDKKFAGYTKLLIFKDVNDIKYVKK